MPEEKKIVLVTGASRGIGRAIVEYFASSKHIVFGTATSDEGANQITEYLSKIGVGGRGLPMVINEQESVEGVIRSIEAEAGEISVLINNAGMTKDQLFIRMTNEDWDHVIDTNLSGVFRITKLVSRKMIRKKYGRIVNITSVVGHTGNAGQVNYAASKAGIISFSKSLARELGARGVTVNCVSPGFIKTDMTDKLNDSQKNIILNQIPMKKFGDVKNVADAVGFLVSDAANYITGSTIHVNGGLLME